MMASSGYTCRRLLLATQRTLTTKSMRTHCRQSSVVQSDIQTCNNHSYSRSYSKNLHRHNSTNAQAHNVICQENGEPIIRSPYPDVTNEPQSFAEFMFPFLDEYKNIDMMIDYPTGRRFSGAKLKESAIKVASALTRLRYKRGDVVLLFSTNCIEYPILFLACGVKGLPISTANPIYTPGELSRQLAHSESKAVFTTKVMLPTVTEALTLSQEASERVKEIIIIDGEADKCRPFSTLIEDDGHAFPENVDIDPFTTILTLPYSSGTTGLPKGVMLSHYNMVSNLVQAMKGQMKFRPGEDVLMGLLPFYHIYGMMVLQISSLTQGAQVIIHPRFDPQTFLKSIEEFKVTYAHLVPPVVLFMAKSPELLNYNLKSLQTLVSAAAPLGIGVTEEVENKLGVNLIQAYGLTECSPLTHYDEVPAKKGTIGTLVPNTIAKVVDPESGDVLQIGETGEIVVKGPQLMMGYLKNQEATDKTIKDGWLYTGDIGHADTDGYFTISDRLKELIKYKGYQVAPAELEATLCTHPSIQDAAVIGIQAGEDVGEVPRAFVVKRPGHDLHEKDVLEYIEKNVAPYKKLRGGVEFIEEVPKTASGKILRRKLMQN